MPYQLVKFTCKYCGREYKLEKNAEEHEKKCYHNEVNRACVTCGNFQEFNTEPVYVGYIKVVNVEKRCILDLDETFDDNGCTINSLNNHCNGWVKKNKSSRPRITQEELDRLRTPIDKKPY